MGPALDQAGAAQDGGAAGAALDEGCRIGENLESETAGAARVGGCRVSSKGGRLQRQPVPVAAGAARNGESS